MVYHIVYPMMCSCDALTCTKGDLLHYFHFEEIIFYICLSYCSIFKIFLYYIKTFKNSELVYGGI